MDTLSIGISFSHPEDPFAVVRTAAEMWAWFENENSIHAGYGAADRC